MYKMAPSQFAKKCPNRQTLMDLFNNHCQQYTPPFRYMTSAFGRDVLCGKKKLLKKSEVKWVEHLPNWSEFSTKRIWGSAKTRPEWPEV